jgi:hypothetical protein
MAQAFRSVATVTNNVASNTIVVPAPAGVIDGDLLVLGLVSDHTTNAFNTLAGWTKLNESWPNGQYSHQVFYKIAAGEPASYTWTMSGGAPKSCAVMGALTGIGTTFDAQSFTFTAAGGNIVITDITTTKPNQMLFWICSRTGGAGNILPPPNLLNRGGNVNTGSNPSTTPQLNFACEIFPTATVTTFPWSRGSFASGTSRATVSFFAFQDAIPVAPANVPLLFCEA